MSQGVALRWTEAHEVAERLVALLADDCDRIEIAGSLRRQKPEVHDIEIVAIPRTIEVAAGDLWGEQTVRVDRLASRLAELLALGAIQVRDVEVHRADGTVEIGRRMGAAYKAIVHDGIPVDLFITDAERWGCIYALRTGPGDWNARLVTDCKSHFRAVADGRVTHFGKVIPTPEEADFFRALCVPWVEPRDRRLDTLRFDWRQSVTESVTEPLTSVDQ